MDNEQYLHMCKKILDNSGIDAFLLDLLTDSILNSMSLSIMSLWMWLLQRKHGTIYRLSFPKVPTFYSIPKAHKSPNNPPERPIISRNGTLTENLSRLIDEHLRPHVISLTSYVKDTIHFLKIHKNLYIPVPTHSHLVTIDIEAL